jgi:hypothetical protein
MEPKLKPPGTKRFKLEYDGLLSNFAFRFNLRRYTGGAARCTALLSATLTAGTSRLIDLAMVNPVTIEIDAEEAEEVGAGWKAGDANSHRDGKKDSGMEAAARAAGGGQGLTLVHVRAQFEQL